MMRFNAPWLTEPCRLSKTCKFYGSDSHTCNDDDEAVSDCGYLQLE